jgi:hypothetical protein
MTSAKSEKKKKKYPMAWREHAGQQVNLKFSQAAAQFLPGNIAGASSPSSI